MLKYLLPLTIVVLLIVFISNCGSGSGGSSTRHAPPSNQSANADLAELILSDVTLEQTFQSSQNEYTASTKFLTHTTRVTPITIDPGATVTVNDMLVASGTATENIWLSEGINNIKVKVTAENKVTTRIYTLEITRETSSDFSQQTIIEAINVDEPIISAWSVALSEDTTALGSPYARSDGQEDPASGAVYVFRRSGGAWTQEAHIRASNLEAGDQFGYSVSLDGDTLAVGSPGEDSNATGGDRDNSEYSAGAVYIFSRIGSTWAQEAYLKASDASRNDRFGTAVSLNGDNLAIGAPGGGQRIIVDGDSYDSGGSVYLFSRSDGFWRQITPLSSSNPDSGDKFGASVSLYENTLAVGAPGDDSSPTGGASDVKPLSPVGGDQLGFSIAVSADTLVVGKLASPGGDVFVFQ